MDILIVLTAVIALVCVSLPWTFSAAFRGRQYDQHRYGYGSLRALRRDGRGSRGFFTWWTFLALIGYSGAARAAALLVPGGGDLLRWVADGLIGLTLVFLVCHVTTVVTGKPAALVRVPRQARHTGRSARRGARYATSKTG